MKRLISIVLAVAFLFACCSLTVFADFAEPTDSFSRFTLPNGTKKTVAVKPVFKTDNVVSLRSLGIEGEFGEITDIDCDDNGLNYVLFNNSKIISFDKNYDFVEEYTILTYDGKTVDFSGASGILCGKNDREIYIADTKNARVLWCRNNVVFKEILLPDNEIIPSDFVFQPVKVALDSKGYLYVLSDGSYYGALLYDPQGEFVGFYGANNVKKSALTTLSYLWDRLTKNDIKRAKTVKTLPYQFADICVDKRDFAYTCTGKTSMGDAGQIRILSPGGTNILVGAENTNYGEMDKVVRRQVKVNQNFCAVDVDNNGFIYALDQSYGLIYVYDNKSNLIVAFGGGRGLGNQKGNFSNACSLAVYDSKIFVADSLKGTVTVFSCTDYGALVLEAQRLTLKSDYLNAESLWNDVLKQDATNYLAFSGLAKANYMKGEYSKSLNYAKHCGDNTTYSQSLQKLTNEYVTKNFVFIFLIAVLIVAALITLIIVSVRKRIVFIKNEKVRLALGCMIHPFKNFNEIRYKNKGSLLIATIISLLFFVSSVVCVTLSDFRYTSYNPADYNILYQVVQTLCLIALFTLSNWCVSALLIGRGKLKDVYIVTAYCTVPLVFSNLIVAVVSHFIISADSSLVAGINAIGYILAGIVLFIGLMIIHDFAFSKVLASIILTVLFMILVIFVIFMLGVLLSQFWEFFVSIFLEVVRL